MSPPPDPHPREPKLRAPPGACDCHLHLFGPKSRYPLAPDARYDTEDALPETYLALQEVLGLGRGVVVQATAQGHDHGALFDALRAYPERFRGIAVPPPEVTDEELDRMHDLGIRGIRIVSASTGLAADPEGRSPLDRRLIERIASRAWHVQILAAGSEWARLKDDLLALHCDVVIDHVGLVAVEQGLGGPEFRAVLEMVEGGRVWVKLSGPMRFSRQRELPYSDTLPFYHALVQHAPERMVWGSDWPHIRYSSVMPNDGDLLDLLLEWVPEQSVRNRILAENPARLYDFPPPA